MRAFQKIAIFGVKIYQKILSPIIPGKCKFVPTCSRYTIESIEKFGAVKGILLGTKRIIRCNPWTKPQYDPVPENLKGDFKWLQ